MACASVNATIGEDEMMERICTEKLFGCLNELEIKYGRLPSIVATRADFAQDIDPVPLWEEAYSLARARADSKNQLAVAESLSSYFLNAKNYSEALKWANSGEALLLLFPDEFHSDQLRQTKEQALRESGEPSG